MFTLPILALSLYSEASSSRTGAIILPEATPFSPEIDQDRSGGLSNFGVEVVAGDRDSRSFTTGSLI